MADRHASLDELVSERRKFLDWIRMYDEGLMEFTPEFVSVIRTKVASFGDTVTADQRETAVMKPEFIQAE